MKTKFKKEVFPSLKLIIKSQKRRKMGFAQPLELMKYYVEAFHKAFENIEEVMKRTVSLKPRESIKGTAEIK